MDTNNNNLMYQQFNILSITALTANTAGFIANFILFGLEVPTQICGACALLMLMLSLIGKKEKMRTFATGCILGIVNLFEFPYLYLIYGKSTICYLVLGIVAIIFFGKKKYRICYSTFVMIFDSIFIIVCDYMGWYSNIVSINALGATVSTFLIVCCCLVSLTILIVNHYELRNRELSILTEKLDDMANLDALTDIYNRRYLTSYLEELINKKEEFSIILIDIDDFKLINDRYGHVYGDEVLKSLSNIISTYIDGKGIVARFGGEEFMIVIKQHYEKEISALMTNISKDFATFSQQTKGVDITFSGGVDKYEMNERITDLFDQVDQLLYAAKRSGKNNVIFKGDYK